MAHDHERFRPSRRANNGQPDRGNPEARIASRDLGLARLRIIRGSAASDRSAARGARRKNYRASAPSPMPKALLPVWTSIQQWGQPPPVPRLEKAGVSFLI